MDEFIIYRYGANGANQHRQHKAVVGTIDAVDGESACKRMAGRIMVYSNQHLTWNFLSKASAKDRREAQEQNLQLALQDEADCEDQPIVDNVCPDGPSCPDPACIAERQKLGITLPDGPDGERWDSSGE